MVVAGLQQRRRAGRARDGGDRLRRLRGQGRQELHRDRVPLRLPEGQALGRRDRRGPRARDPVRGRADRRRARAHPDHEPDLDRAVQGDRGGEDAQRDRLQALGARRALRASAPSRSSRRPARRPACRPTRCRSSPTPRSTSSQYLFHHPGVDFIWTTGGPKAVAAANEAGKPCISVGPGNAPVYIHGSADVRMAVVDMLISKTFDASVICPAEQTCVIDDAVWDETVAELQRHGRAPARRRTRSSAWPRVDVRRRRQRRDRGARPVLRSTSARWRASRSAESDKVLLAPLPSDLDELGAPPARCTRS